MVSRRMPVIRRILCTLLVCALLTGLLPAAFAAGSDPDFSAPADKVLISQTNYPIVNGLTESQVVCVGDQIFKDILGANRCGMASILVDFIRLPDEKHFGKRRAAEKVILWFYQKNRRCYNRLDIAR